jgi:hypothetical protein
MKLFVRLLFSVIAASLLFVVTGCNTVSTSSRQFIGGPVYPPSNPAQIQILRTAPSRLNTPLGQVSVVPSSDAVPVQKIEAALQAAAAKMGADAVVIQSDRTEVTGAMIVGPRYGYGGRSIERTTERVITGLAIKYTEP